MPIKISTWNGRLGNNIQQCAVAILLALSRKDTFESPAHEIIKPFFLDFGKREESFISEYFFWNGNKKVPNISTNKIYKDIQMVCQKYIIQNLDVPKIIVPNDTLVIHLRSGDVFKKGLVHKDYVPNPFIYYERLISLFNRVIIVTEGDNNNPILRKISKNPKVEIQSSTIKEDFSTLLSAQNLASSGVGTFAMSAALCSKNLKNFYSSNIKLDRHLNYKMISNKNVNIYICHINNYIKIGEWENNPYQRSLIINFKKDINFTKYKKISFYLFINNLLTDIELKYKILYRINKIYLLFKKIFKI